jgi:transposase
MNYYLGVDVSKGYADFVLLDQHKNITEKNFQLDDTIQGHQRLMDFLRDFFEEHPHARLHAAVESTGGYENNWLNTLQGLESQCLLFSTRLNPKGVHHHSKAVLKRIITDKVSAQNIAEYLISHSEKISYGKNDPYTATRNHWNLIQLLIKQKVQLLNQLEKVLYRANPELLVYWRKRCPCWMLKVLTLYPTARQLSKADLDKMVQVPYISATKARQLIEKAKTSVASAQDGFTENLIKSLAQEILHKQSLIEQQTDLLISHCHLPEVKLLESIPGIGTFSAIGLFVEIGNIERFTSAKKLASFFGLHPMFKESGDGTWGMRMSKEGRSQPRAILFMSSLVAVQYNPVIQKTFVDNLNKGKCKMDALGVCMHKLLRIIYGILKTHTPFDTEIDRNNQRKHARKRKGFASNRLRRFQKQDPDAPVSFRKNKKRKEQYPSQGDKITKHEIVVPALSSSDT